MSGSEPRARVRLTDESEGLARTTGSLVASFAARLGALGYVTAGEAFGSGLSGVRALGREVACTAEGERLRCGLERSRAGANAEVLWSALRVDDWLARIPPAPVLSHLHNDVAMLLAEDMSWVFPAAEAGVVGVPAATVPQPQPVQAIDLLVGLWAWGRELVRAVETMAGELSTGVVEPPLSPSESPLDGGLLR